MKRFLLYIKVFTLFLKKRFISTEDIGLSYDKVSQKYKKIYLQKMHSYNYQLLQKTIDFLKNKNNLHVLDLAGGTGYNTENLKQYCHNCRYDVVDISKGMLKQVPKSTDVACFQSDMISFLQQSEENKYDLIICSWALKYQNPQKIIKQCFRILKKNGIFAVIVNTKQTLPEVRKIYSSLLYENISSLQKLMLELPNPKNEQQLNKWITKKGFQKKFSQSGSQVISFASSALAVEFVTSTGALAGFDMMLDLHNEKIKKQMITKFEQTKTKTITHYFVYGIYQKD